MQAQSFEATAGIAMNQSQASGSMTGGTPAQPKQRVRARRGQATDPHNIAERELNQAMPTQELVAIFSKTRNSLAKFKKLLGVLTVDLFASAAQSLGAGAILVNP
ncbi:hypothetical protein PTKIN_Ptkin08bG0051600 [Pterospermum kingtungense]